METFIIYVDKFTGWVGKAFAWTILLLTFGVTYEVFVRYIMRNPTSWSYDVSYMMYGLMFMMAGAYTLSRDGHVRGDVIYRLWKPTTQAIVELILYFFFFFPGIFAFIFAGADYARESWSYTEVSVMSPANIPIFQFKTVIPVAGGLLLLQGLAQVCRCIVCLKTGQWPAHQEDVEELETVLQHEHEAEEAEYKTVVDGNGSVR